MHMTFIRGVLHFIDCFVWAQICTGHFYLNLYHVWMRPWMLRHQGNLILVVGQTLNRIGQQLNLNSLLQRQAGDCDRRLGLCIPRC